MMKNTIKILMTSAMFFGLSSSPALNAALSCDASNGGALDWLSADWPDPGTGAAFAPTLSHTETVNGVDFNFAFSGRFIS